MNRKRKQEDDGVDGDTQMSRSPSGSPSLQANSLPKRNTKRARTNAIGRPLGLPRLLETLSPDDLRGLLKSICDRHPQLTAEVASIAPRPNVENVLSVLQQYETTFRNSFPFGGKETSDYAYNRVRQPLTNFLDALKDYTPNFLPPNEAQTAISLDFLDAVTNMIHRLPNWDNFQNNRHKHEAYEEIAKAWANVIRESAKRAGGFKLRINQWDQKLLRHNETSGNRLGEAINALNTSLDWIGHNDSAPPQNDPASIRQQLLNGTYGEGVRAGTW